MKAVLIQKFIFLIINIRVQGLAVFLLNDMLGERIVVYMLELFFFFSLVLVASGRRGRLW